MLRPLAATLLVLAVLGTAACSSAPAPTGPDGGAATTPARTTTSGSAASSGSATGGATSGPSGSVDGWYLALGDSLAAGLQPTTGDEPTRGYAGPVLAALRQTQPGTDLTNLGCSGETTGSMMRGGLCRYAEGTQLASATAFLRAQAGRVRLVTLDIGANNVLRCAAPAVDQACAASAGSAAASDVVAILSQLRTAAPDATIVVLTYYNPLLAAYRQGAGGQQVAAQSQPLLAGLNRSLAAAAAAPAVQAKVADVAGAFATTDSTGSPEPVNVARICAWTWMCSRGDIHANDAGYAAMAKAVLAAR